MGSRVQCQSLVSLTGIHASHALIQQEVLTIAYRVAEDTAEWADWLANNARSFRRALLAHRDGALLHAGTTPARVGGETFYPKVAYLMRAGFSEAEAAMILLTMSEYTLGCVLEEQSRTDRHDDERLSTPSTEISRIDALTHQHPDTCFEFGLSLIMKGLLK